ncbi:hypothetical protein Tco_0818855 [Tanacetum coccineum]
MENMGLTFAQVSSKAHSEGVWLRVVDSHTGNHTEGGFMPFKTIRRFSVIIRKRSNLDFEGEAFEPKRRDTIVVQRCGLLAKELNKFLSSYPIPSEYDVILPASTQTIFDAPPDSIIPSKFSQLLLDENKLDLKSFKDKLPPNIYENPYFQRLGWYPTSVRVFDDPILFLGGLKPSWEFGQQWPAIIVGDNEMAFRNFIYTEDDDDLAFLSKEPSLGFGIGSPSALVNTEPPKDVEEPKVQPAEVTKDSGESLKASVFVVHPGSVAARIKERKSKTSASKDDASFLSISDDDEGLPDCFELKDSNTCHLKISAPSAWRGHLDNQMDLELLDLHDRSDIIKARERSREEDYEGLRAKCEATMAEFDQNPAVLAFWEKISSLSAEVKEHKEADKARLEAVKASLCGEIKDLRQDKRDVVSKVVPYAAMELVHIDELGRLMGKLVSSAITYRRCRAYEQVAAMKEPFDLSKVKGYHSSYQKEHTQASNDFATTTFPWLDKFIADAAAPIEALLSKKPPIL